PLTVRDSSLSACTQAVMAAEVGHLGLAFDYLGEAALMDLHDLEHNTRDRVHIAPPARAWVAPGGGFPGPRHRDGPVSLAPRLPEGISRLAFNLLIRGQRLRVEVNHASARYLLEDGGSLEIIHHGEMVKLAPGKAQELPISAISPRSRPS